jgi:hypothetical protein
MEHSTEACGLAMESVAGFIPSQNWAKKVKEMLTNNCLTQLTNIDQRISGPFSS